MPNIGEQEFEPLVAPPGFGGQGVVQPSPMPTPSPVAAPVTPPGPPAGFESGSSPRLAAAAAAPAVSPFAAYAPSALSPVRHEYEDSTLFKIGSVLASYGESVPVNMKIRMAQQESDIKMAEHKMAVSNYYQQNEVTRELLKKHNREAQKEFLSVLPNMKAQITSMSGAPKEEQEIYVTHLKNMAESFHPGGGDIIDFFYKNQSVVYAGDAILSNTDPNISGPARQSMNSMGYDNWIKSPAHAAFATIMNTDFLTAATTRLPKTMQDKLAAKNMPENEFRESVKAAAYEKGMRPVDVTSMLMHMDTQNGQNQMHRMGVKIDTIEQAVEKKGFGNQMNAKKAADLERIEFKLDHAQELGLTGEEISELNQKRDIALQYNRPQSMPGESRSDLRANTLADLSGGRYSTTGDVLAKTKEGSVERAQGLAWAQQATQVKKEASAQAQLGARLEEPAKQTDLTNIFSAKQLLTNHMLAPVGPQSTRQLRTDVDNVSVSPDEQIKYANITKSKLAGKDLFDMAEKLFTDTSALGVASRTSQMLLLDSPLTAGPVKLANPALGAYHDDLEAWAGNNAKALGGEVGVLTNVDIDRWVRTFPTGSDNPKTVKLKRKIFERMTDLVRDTQEQILAGRYNPTRDADGRIADKAFRQKVEGILGSAEQLTPKVAPADKSKLSPREKLEQQMKAE